MATNLKFAPTAPCKNCDKRHFKCHNECPDYISYRKGREKVYEEKVDEMRNQDLMFDSIYKNRKWKHQR